jgi:uncharacterized protein YecE (DUF72 family)
MEWRIGCSGFAYKEWKDAFYPPKLPQSRWFAYYASQFNTLELNVTFYRFPSLKSLQGWYEKAPDDFSFSAKVPRSITHYKRFSETEGMLEDFYGLLKEGLREKLACVLFQLPPQLTYHENRLERILMQMNDAFSNVIEFRHESWWRMDVQQALAARNVAFCGVSFPTIIFDDPVFNTATAYYRFHGVPRLFYSQYSDTFVKDKVDRIANSDARKAYLYFNNTASMAALTNARYAQGLVQGFRS